MSGLFTLTFIRLLGKGRRYLAAVLSAVVIALYTLLLAESGYAPANPPAWIAKLRPQVVLLSVGAGDFTGLTSPEMIEAVEGYTLLRTDQNGWIEITTDGELMWVEVDKR